MQTKYFNLRILFCAVLAAAFFISAVFLSAVILWKLDSTVTAFTFTAFMAVIYGAVFISGKMRECILKWILSVPLSFLFLLYFQKTDFLRRTLNWAYPGYGDLTAGGANVIAILFITFTIICFMMLIAAFCISSAFAVTNKPFKLEKLQLCICGAIGAVVIFVVILLERQLPLYVHFIG